MNQEVDNGLGTTLNCFEEGKGDVNNEYSQFLEKEQTKENKLEIENTADDEIKDFLSSPDVDSGPPEVTVVPREEWSKIEPPEQYAEYKEPVQYVLLTHTGTSSCTKSDECIRILRTLQRTHIALGYADIVYNFLIGGDGKVYEGRGWRWESAWIPKLKDPLGPCMKIAHIGYYGDYSKKKVEPKQVKLQCDLIETGMYKNFVQWNATMLPDHNEPGNVEEI